MREIWGDVGRCGETLGERKFACATHAAASTPHDCSCDRTRASSNSKGARRSFGLMQRMKCWSVAASVSVSSFIDAANWRATSPRRESAARARKRSRTNGQREAAISAGSFACSSSLFFLRKERATSPPPAPPAPPPPAAVYVTWAEKWRTVNEVAGSAAAGLRYAGCSAKRRCSASTSRASSGGFGEAVSSLRMESKPGRG